MEESILTPQSIYAALNTRFIGQKVILYPTLTSTMQAAKQEAQWGAEAGTVIIADEQTAGIGRLKRNWISPRGALALSVILRPNIRYLPFMIMLSSLAVTYSIEKVTGLKPQIKWPNDILINNKKVSGILIQNSLHASSLQFTVIGIGININLQIQDYPEIAAIATSLSDEVGEAIPRLDLLHSLLSEMEQLYFMLPENERIFEQWRDRLITLGQEVQVIWEDTEYTGIAEDVTRDGGLMLRQLDGSLIPILAGDVNPI